MREQTAGVENVGVSPMDRKPENHWDGVKFIQICYLTYEIRIIRQYNKSVKILIFSSFNLTWHRGLCRLVYILDVAFVIQDSNHSA